MNESTDNKTERKRLSLQGPVPVEVKQSFSNRRSKTVQVEHKIGRGARKPGGDHRVSLSSDEMNRRTEALKRAKNTDGGDVGMLPPLPKDVGQKVYPKVIPERLESSPVKFAQNKPDLVETAEIVEAVSEHVGKEANKKRAVPLAKPIDKKVTSNFVEIEKQKKTLRLKGDAKRRQGKLTISEALTESDGGYSVEQRGRSLAAIKRARDKERQQNLEKLKSNEKVIRDVIVPETLTVSELANRMAERVGDVVKALMKMDVLVTPAQNIDADIAELVVSEFGHRIKRVAEADVEDHIIRYEISGDTESRPPIVSIMGHVDHGKTTLLDALRKSNVVSNEAGGITQHIGAYQVTLDNGEKITFLDTPGHQAFTAMRVRGANSTDITILVIAADDGVREQTIESINHARAAKTPIIVAITKSDKPNTDIPKIYNDLLAQELIVETLGGDVLHVEISAEKGMNLDKLQEAILLQAEIIEIKANSAKNATGVVIESRLDKGRGNMATFLVQNGTLRKGDIFVAGGQWGRVRALLDSSGAQLQAAVPSSAVEVLGLQGLSLAGDRFDVVESEVKAREIAAYRQRQWQKKNVPVVSRGLEHMFSQIQLGNVQEVAIILKADVQGSLEALKNVIEKTSHEEVQVKILHSGVGGITESDIALANTSQAFLIGFNVRANMQARKMADLQKIEIRYYSVIYHIAEDLEKMVKGMLVPEVKETFLGYADILEVFNVTKIGKVAGCMVTEGVVRRASQVRLLRDDVVIFQGLLKQLKRFKDDVREVTSNFECGIALENYDDLKAGDRIECFDVKEIPR